MRLVTQGAGLARLTIAPSLVLIAVVLLIAVGCLTDPVLLIAVARPLPEHRGEGVRHRLILLKFHEIISGG